ncbi:MAG: DUF3455 domain-containing protein [Xanthobacteraceae bacterium]
MTRVIGFSVAILAAAFCANGAMAQTPQVPAAVAASGATTVATFHGVGAQVYECKTGQDGKLAWSFREPIATLIENGKTAGRHYAGPTWEDVDGSKVVAKTSGHAPGATANDIPWLKLDVVKHIGRRGILSKVTTIQRLDTQGGVLTGSCDKAGDFKSVPYTATYVVLRKGK